ncbi:alginate lyase family protein [Thiovibrio sp. JS02]
MLASEFKHRVIHVLRRLGEIGVKEAGRLALTRFAKQVRNFCEAQIYERWATDSLSLCVYRRLIAPGAGEINAAGLVSRPFLLSDPALAPDQVGKDCVAAAVKDGRRIVDGYFRIFGLDLYLGQEISWHQCLPECGQWPHGHFSRLRSRLFANDFGCKEYLGDILYSWELGKHPYLFALGRAYRLTGDEVYAQTFMRHFRSWREQNNYMCSIHWMNSLLVTQRGIAWLFALDFFAPVLSRHNTEAESFLGELYLHAKYVYENQEHYIYNNNHLFSNIAFLYTVSLAFPEFADASKWLRSAKDLLYVELKRQVYEDGVNFEQSSIYHRYVTEFCLLMLLVAERFGEKKDAEFLRNRVERMVEFMMCIADPSGDLPVIGDNYQTRVFSLSSVSINNVRDLFAIAAVIFARADFKAAANGEHEVVAWLFGRDGLEKLARLPPPPPVEPLKVFPDGGFFVFRDGRGEDASSLIFDCGYIGLAKTGINRPAHGHSDTLAVVATIRGRPFLVDSGSYANTGSLYWHNALRTTCAHNTVTVDGQDQCGLGSFWVYRRYAEVVHRGWRTGEEGLPFAFGVHDGFSRKDAPLLHRREVAKCCNGNGWVIRDSFDSRIFHEYVSRFHFHPAVRLSVDETNGKVSATRDGRHLVLSVTAEYSDGRRFVPCFAHTSGWYSPDYGIKVPCPLLEISWRTPLSFVVSVEMLYD